VKPMSRCPECNKFVSFAGDEEPEEESVSLEDDGSYVVEVRIHKDCAECGDEIAEALLEVDGTFADLDERDAHWRQVRGLPEEAELPEEAPHGHSLKVSLEDLQGTERRDKKKTFYGFSGVLQVTCECGVGLGDQEVGDATDSGGLDPIE
jgi:hypothetical protein